MKILIYSGGLGNQLFCYSFSCYMRRKYPLESIYGYYPTNMLNEHHGLEIDKWFDVSLPQQKWWTKVVLLYYFILKRLFSVNVADKDLRSCNDESKPVIFAFKQNIRYYNFDYNIKFKIDTKSLSPKNMELLSIIQKKESVFIHVRKGDYLSERYREKYKGTCTSVYYREAIQLISSRVSHPFYICFSDDINWVNENIGIEATIVDWNKGEKSPLDMFMMSKCKYAIIANSTFSYWAAMLGEKKEIVIYPKLWENSEVGSPDIFPSNWIAL